jgi:hypothetical protein
LPALIKILPEDKCIFLNPDILNAFSNDELQELPDHVLRYLPQDRYCEIIRKLSEEQESTVISDIQENSPAKIARLIINRISLLSNADAVKYFSSEEAQSSAAFAVDNIGDGKICFAAALNIVCNTPIRDLILPHIEPAEIDKFPDEVLLKFSDDALGYLSADRISRIENAELLARINAIKATKLDLHRKITLKEACLPVAIACAALAIALLILGIFAISGALLFAIAAIFLALAAYLIFCRIDNVWSFLHAHVFFMREANALAQDQLA